MHKDNCVCPKSKQCHLKRSIYSQYKVYFYHLIWNARVLLLVAASPAAVDASAAATDVTVLLLLLLSISPRSHLDRGGSKVATVGPHAENKAD